jgi:PAS domain S-box-containing protein
VNLKPVVIDGAPQILAFTRDISGRKAAEERLRASEAQYRAIFDASADALMLWNSQLVRVDVNPAHARIFGFAREDVVGRAFEGLPYPDEFVRPRLEMVRRALGGEASRLEIAALRKDGTHILTELRTIPFTHGGEPHALQIARDITEHKAAEERLRLSEQQYRAIFNASVDALALWDGGVRRVDINVSYERLYGWSREDVIGKGYEHLPFGEEYCAPRRALVQRALAGEACSAELVSIRKDGQRILTEIHAVPFSHRGEPHVLVIGRDITERRAAEAERARLEEQLRQAQKMEAIGQLTGGIAHDFNNILTSVLGYVALARERADSLPDQRLLHQLQQAQRAGERARDLVAQTLAFARRGPSRRQVLAPRQLLLDTVDLLRPTLPSSVLLEVAEAVPTVPAVEVDAVEMGQVLMNLLINARDAVAGVGRVKVGLRTAGDGWRCAACASDATGGTWVEISVEDDGCGIAKDVLPRVFDPFFSTKPAGHGTGMGLAMVHGIVHDHGGHVVVETEPGAGTAFRVLLPATARAPAIPEAVQSAHGASTATLSGSVLVVEDDTQVGSYLAEQLGAWGLDVTLRADSREAQRWLRDATQVVDLVITDMTMPHVSGLDLAARAMQARPGVPVVLISADLAAADARALAASGVRARLTKPLDAAALRRVITEALGGQL